MSNDLERSLDEIIGSDSQRSRNRPERRQRDRSRERPRGPRKDNYRDRYEAPRKTKLQRLSNGNAYLKISNLHPDITNDDLTQLFESIGKTSFALIEHDHSNRGSRLGYIGYEDVSLNEQAVEKFDGRKAVGQIITVEDIRPLNILSVSDRPDSRSGPRGKRRGGRERPAPRPRANAEDLDKELESYMNRETPSSGGRSNGKNSTVEDLDKELESYMDDKPFPVAH